MMPITSHKILPDTFAACKQFIWNSQQKMQNHDSHAGKRRHNCLNAASTPDRSCTYFGLNAQLRRLLPDRKLLLILLAKLFAVPVWWQPQHHRMQSQTSNKRLVQAAWHAVGQDWTCSPKMQHLQTGTANMTPGTPYDSKSASPAVLQTNSLLQENHRHEDCSST